MRAMRTVGAIALGTMLTLAACGGGDDAADEPATGGDGGAGATITFSSTDKFRFDPETAEIKAGEVHIVHDNKGATTHSFVLDGQDVRLVDDADTTVELAPGEYTYYCDVPGHREAGMEGVLTVDP